jgi:hypothetical protein
MILIMRFWSWDFLQQATVVNSSTVSPGTLSVKFDANYVSVFDEPRFGKKDSRVKSVSTKEVVSGLSNGEFTILDEIKDVKMKYPDGNPLSSEYISNKQDMITYSDENFMLPIQSALKDEKLLNPYKGFSYSKIFSLDESKFHQYKDEKGDYSAHAVFDIYQYNITLRMPLKTGAKCRFGAQEVVIYDILKKENAISVIINEKKINLVFDRNVKKTSMADFAQHMYSEYDHIYLIVNTKRHEAFLPETGINLFSGIMELYSQSRFKTMATKLDFTNLNSRNGPLPEIDEQWLADGELVRLDAVKVRV